jgi:hypothetical protein
MGRPAVDLISRSRLSQVLVGDFVVNDSFHHSAERRKTTTYVHSLFRCAFGGGAGFATKPEQAVEMSLGIDSGRPWHTSLQNHLFGRNQYRSWRKSLSAKRLILPDGLVSRITGSKTKMHETTCPRMRSWFCCKAGGAPFVVHNETTNSGLPRPARWGALSFHIHCKSRARLPSSDEMKCNKKKAGEMKCNAMKRIGQSGRTFACDRGHDFDVQLRPLAATIMRLCNLREFS